MFDPAILLSLEATMPPQPPVTAQERVWLSPKGTAAQRVSGQLTESYRIRADEWARQLNTLRAQFEAFAPVPPENAATLDLLDRLIEDFEAHADIRAATSARLAKRIRRDVKAMFKVEPSVAAVARATGDRIIATDKRIVEELLDYALFLRALRAEAAGEDRGGPTFDDADALKKHLGDLAA